MVFGRTYNESADSNSSNHIWAINIHNASENPAIGRSGRIPSKTFGMIAASRLIYSKGLWPVITCGGNVRHVEEATGNRFARASRIVIPKAYISVLLDGNFFRACLIYPYFSGSRISECRACLADFGLATIIQDTSPSEKPRGHKAEGTTRWMAPELIRIFACVHSQLPINIAWLQAVVGTTAHPFEVTMDEIVLVKVL